MAVIVELTRSQWAGHIIRLDENRTSKRALKGKEIETDPEPD